MSLTSKSTSITHENDEQKQEQFQQQQQNLSFQNKKKQKPKINNNNKKVKNKIKNDEDICISEYLKILIHKEIDEFLRSFDERVEFPPNLTKTQRSYVHNYVKKFGLLSKSYGKNQNRYLIVSKRVNKSDKNSSWLCLKNESKKLLENYFSSFKENNHSFEQGITSNLNKTDSFNKNYKPDLVRMGDLLHLNSSIKIPIRSNCPKHLLHEKYSLPVYQYRRDILETIAKNQVVIINGDTGSGKTTQIPQYILEDAFEQFKPCRIICTQPRRMATVTIAHRVAQERGEILGNTVGYQIRLERCYSRTSNLIYTTSGCVLRSLMANVHDTYNDITHIIIDEIHERDKNTDFILISLHDQLYKYQNKNLKVILMSATMDIELLSKYFGGCKIITVPGKCYETKIYYLEEILYCTEYKTKKMLEYINEMNLIKSMQTSMKVSTSSSPSTTTTTTTTNFEDDYNNDNVKLDKETQKYVDLIIEQCYSNKCDVDEHFSQLLYLIECENLSINVKHSKTHRTPLIVAAQMNNYEYVEKFLKLNANQYLCDKNEMTAIRYSSTYSDKRCFKLLNEYSKKFNNNQQHWKQNCQLQQQQQQQKQNQSNIEIDQLLDAYQKQFNDDDEIDHYLLTTLIKMIHNSNNYGSILVFLPGYNDICIQKDELNENLTPGTYKLFLLHSNMKMEDQQNVLDKLPKNIRKIILSTNISETSITFPDVVFVIDCGKIKMNTYDSITGTSYLKSMWVSKACAKQRAGRAGRTQPGICYRMYSRKKYESMDEFLMPEFLRVPLTEICLYAKVINKNLSISSYLLNSLTPPSNVNISNAVNKLKTIGAIDNNENITLLGEHLVNIPLDVQLGKCLLYSLWMRCLDPILTIVAFHSVKDPFVLPSDKSERGKASSRRKLFCGNSFSDHIGIINLFKQWKTSKYNHNDLIFCSENYLTSLSLDMINACRKQILDQIRIKYNLKDNNTLMYLNENSNDWQIIYSCLCAGLYPNICYIDRYRMKITSRLEKSIAIHPSSALKPPGYRELNQYIGQLQYDWIVFFEKTRFNRFGNIRFNTIIPSIIIALFCGIGILPHNENIDKCNDNDNENVETKNCNGNELTNSNNENNNDCNDDENDDIEDDEDEIDEENIDGVDDADDNNKNMKNRVTVDDWIEFFTRPDDKDFIEKIKMKINYSFMNFLKNGITFDRNTSFNKMKQINNYNHRNTIRTNSNIIDNDCDELISIIKNLYKHEIGSANIFHSYVTSNDRNEIMTNIGYFEG